MDLKGALLIAFYYSVTLKGKCKLQQKVENGEVEEYKLKYLV